MNDQTPSNLDSFLVRLAGARVAILFAFHAVVFIGCYVLAYLLRFEFAIPPECLTMFKSSLAVVVGLQLAVGVLFGFYRGWWRYVGMADVVRLVFGLSTCAAILLTLWYVGEPLGLDVRFVKSPRGVLMIDWAFALLSLFGARVLIRMGRDRFRASDQNPSAIKRVLIVGAGDAGETLAREIEHRPQLGMKVVGFIDDQRAKWGSHIRGIRVYGPIANVRPLADSEGADEALIAIPSASGKRIREVIHHLSAADLKFKTMPGIDHLVSGKVHVTQLRPVNVEDLLRRRRIDLPGDPVRELFKGKRVLITGAGGTIGAELAAQVQQFEPKSIVLVERSEFALYEVGKRLGADASPSARRITYELADIRDTAVMESLVARERPDIVLHAAAHKHVPLGESNPAEYLHNNTLATRRLAEICTEYDVRRFVLISTDKAINPTSIMGATKRAAEILLLDHAGHTKMKLTIVRFGNVIGSSGSVIPLFLEQIAAGGPLTVTHPDVTRYFIRTSEAISLVLQAATLGDGGHVFTLDMGEPVRIVDLARDIIRVSNHTEDEIPIVFTGLRSGEKLFEEIRMKGESVHSTIHPQIVITESSQPDSAKIQHWIARAATRQPMERAQAIQLLSELISEYHIAAPERVDTPAAMRATPALT